MTGAPTSTDITTFGSDTPVQSGFLKPTPMAYLPTDAPDTGYLADFLARPIEIHVADWTLGIPPNTTIDPWATFLNDPAVQDKIKNFARLRATLNLEIQCNGTPFHYGAVLAAYEPANGLRISNASDTRQHSCLQHGFINPTNSQSVRLTCPFMHPMNWIDLSASNGAAIGVLHLNQAVPLLSASSSTDPVTITVYAWMTDVQLSFPTNRLPATFLPQSKKVTRKGRTGGQVGKDEYEIQPNSGMISRPAAAIANIASKLTMVPVLAPWATATQIGATAVGNMASLFGYSRPTDLTPAVPYLSMPVSTMAATDTAVNAVPLTLGSKSELTIDPKAIGYDTNEDELTLYNIVAKPTYMENLAVLPGATVGTVLGSYQVHPMSMSTNSLGAGIDGGELTMSSMAFGSVPFKYWAGTIVYRFQVVCSQYHRGRLRIQYTPDANAVLTTNLNTSYNHIFDITPGKEIEVAIPYASSRPATPMLQIGDNSQYTNGTLRVMVQNTITAPESATPIYVMCWIYAGADFKVFEPTSQEFFANEIIPQSSHDVGDSVTEYESVQFFTADLGDAYDLTIFGDPIVSFRPLIKRYSINCASSKNDPFNLTPGSVRRITYRMPMYPQRAGEVYRGTGRRGADQANANQNHLINWLQPSFLSVRGSCRWIADCSLSGIVDQDGVYNGSILASREDSNAVNVRVETNDTVVDVTTEGAATLPIFWDRDTLGVGMPDSFAGAQLFDGANNTSKHMPEIQLPFYFPYRYATNLGSDFSPYYPRQNATFTQLAVARNSSPGVLTDTPIFFYAAAGEDFTMNVYLGPPVWTYHTGLTALAVTNTAVIVRNDPLP